MPSSSGKTGPASKTSRGAQSSHGDQTSRATEPPAPRGGGLFAPVRAVMRVVSAITGPWTRANGVSWLKLIVLILILRWAFFELYTIPSGSMEPVLHGDPRPFRGDRVAVNKFLFGPRIPFTTIRIFRTGEPQRWDIVVFNNVDPTSPNPTLIKRVVGLPGEDVYIRYGRIHVNGEPIDPPEHLREILYYTNTVAPPREMVRDTLLDMAKHLAHTNNMDLSVYGANILAEDLQRLHDKTATLDLQTLTEEDKNALIAEVRPVSLQLTGERLAMEWGINSDFKYALRRSPEFTKIPEEHYLMLGDNSGYSGDGRAFGWVPHKNLYGRAFGVAWPWPRHKDLTGFSDTWWGMLLLYGLPGSYILFEVARSFFVLSWRAGRDVTHNEIQPGDHVAISRIAYGLRLPFSRRQFLGRREPAAGDLVAYLHRDNDSGHVDLAFGRVVTSKYNEYNVRSAAAQHTIDRTALLGRAAAVWWPLRRARKLSSTGAETAASTR